MPLDENAIFDAALAASLLRVDETEREQIQVLWEENEPRLKAVRDASFSDQERPFEGFSLDLGPREADAQPPFALPVFVAETETQALLLHDLIDQSIAIHWGERTIDLDGQRMTNRGDDIEAN